QAILVYQAQSQDLAGTSWVATGYNNGKQAVTSVMAGTRITADFGKGILSGNSGCNDYNGSYTASGGQIKIGPMASTMKTCAAPTGIMDQETQYLAALGSAATYDIQGTKLELRTQDGALAVTYIKK
ncbi:MAG TPA: META domain-containing protein, partial [Candidatus Acidoferrum sp.]|nr:META domain-containing protein [Candidatus Acidoferrum sp.]